MPCGERQIQRSKGSEKWTETGGLLATWGHSDVWIWVAAKAHVCGPSAAIVCFDVSSSGYHQRPRGQAAQSWLCPSLAAILGSAAPASHLGSTQS